MQIGFTGLLTLIFVTLKLTGYVSWPWLWVLAPFWGGLVIAGLCAIGLWLLNRNAWTYR